MRFLLVSTSTAPAEVLTVSDDAEVRLRDIQTAVGGYVEALDVPGREDVIAFVNKEGRLVGAAPNWRGSLLLGQEVVGPVVIGGTTRTGRSQDVPDEVAWRLMESPCAICGQWYDDCTAEDHGFEPKEEAPCP